MVLEKFVIHRVEKNELCNATVTLLQKVYAVGLVLKVSCYHHVY